MLGRSSAANSTAPLIAHAGSAQLPWLAFLTATVQFAASAELQLRKRVRPGALDRADLESALRAVRRQVLRLHD